MPDPAAAVEAAGPVVDARPRPRDVSDSRDKRGCEWSSDHGEFPSSDWALLAFRGEGREVR